uniref:Si:dkey-85k7.7 n=1 Tax=Hippocampus comes TaxID=109280 RepID=A0A3Q2Z0W1_HIPCM
MGVKMLQCFPFYRHCKERCKNKGFPTAAERNLRVASSASWGSDGLARGSHVYFSSKARMSFRHQLDSNVNAV